MEQLVIARPTGIKLRKTLKGDMIKQVEINTLKKGITLFHWLQLSLVLIIFSLSIFVLIKIINDRFFSFEAG
jgi:hypothetical protein